jgi:hypothetical protein
VPNPIAQYLDEPEEHHIGPLPAEAAAVLYDLKRAALEGEEIRRFELDILARRSRDTVDAFLDTSCNKVVLKLKNRPLPSAIARRIDERASSEILSRVPCEGDVWGIRQSLASRMPLDAIELLAAADVALFVPAGRDAASLSKRARRFLAGCPTPMVLEQMFAGAAFGRFHPVTREISVRNNDFVPSWYAVLHEAIHALDYLVLAEAGVPFSARGEWLALFEKTAAAEARGDPSSRFPSRYAAKSPAEFLADCCAILLGNRSEGWCGEEIITRDDFFRANPEAYALAERFFVEVIPAAKRRGRMDGHAASVAHVRQLLREFESGPSSGSFTNLFHAALHHLVLHALGAEDLGPATAAASRAQWRLMLNPFMEIVGYADKATQMLDLRRALATLRMSSV